MQRIVSMLVFQSAAPRSLDDVSPWPDIRAWGPVDPVLAHAEAQTHRRMFKTHLPLDALPIYDGVKFIHVARDGRDAAMSLHNHILNMTPEARRGFDDATRADPKFGHDAPPTPECAAEFFAEWVKDGGALGDEGGSFFHLVNTYWAMHGQPNVMLVHYNDLKADLGGEMRRIAAFLNLDVSDDLWPSLVDAATFARMKADGDVLIPHAHMVYRGGPSRFLYKGSNGRWRGVYRPEDLAHYDAAVKLHFTSDLARWAAEGWRAMPGLSTDPA
jgi:aryl sulfotransferase